MALHFLFEILKDPRQSAPDTSSYFAGLSTKYEYGAVSSSYEISNVQEIVLIEVVNLGRA